MNKIKELEAKLKKEKSKQLFATFCSPGTMFSETSSIKIEKIDLPKICKEAKKIKERYGATPYSFYIADGNGKPKSGQYYLTGEIKKYHDIPDTSEFNILKSNMRCNQHPIAIENRNSYRFTSWFNEDDVILDWEGKVVIRGNSKDLIEYRNKTNKEFEDYYENLRPNQT